MTKVTAAAFAREFGLYRDIAQREPVVVTKHGREDVVVVANAEYQRLKALDARRVQYAWEMDKSAVEAIRNAKPSKEAEALNHLLDP